MTTKQCAFWLAGLFWCSAASSQAGIIPIPNALGLGSDGAGYGVVTDLGTTIENDPAVYLVGTMTFHPDADTVSWDGAQFYNGTGERAGFGKAWQSDSIGISGGTTVASGQALDLTPGVTNTFLMVLKVNQTTGSLTLWVDPDLDQLEVNTTPNATTTLGGQGSYDNVRFRGGANGNDVDYTGFSVYYGGDTPFSTSGGVIPLADAFAQGAAGTGYSTTRSLGLTISNDPAVYLVGTMTFHPDASTATWDSAQFYNGTVERVGFARAFNSDSIGISGDITVPSGQTLDLTPGVTNTFLLVLKVNQTNGALTLWVDPDLNDLEANNPAQATGTRTGQGTYTEVRFRGGANGNDVDYTGFAVYFGGFSPFATLPTTTLAITSFTVDTEAGTATLTFEGPPNSELICMSSPDLASFPDEVAAIQATSFSTGDDDGRGLGVGSAVIDISGGGLRRFYRLELP